MKNINEKDYSDFDLSKAVAFALRFRVPMIYGYDDMAPCKFETVLCEHCGHSVWDKEYLVPKASVRNRKFGYLDIWKYVVDEEIRGKLIENFDITEDDFRPVRTKSGEIVMWEIAPQHVMKPIGNVNGCKKINVCKKCGWTEYSPPKYEIDDCREYYYITKEALDDMHDINFMCEEAFGQPFATFVSRRVYDYLIERYPRMQFAPVFLKESN
ncbi:MAG: hypothetical protein IKV53_07545 [Clostridia bacterium]|nr:hypothetical protein [Clostridia bacterium]